MDHLVCAETGPANSASPQLTLRGTGGPSDPEGLPPPPQSSIDKYGLTFGTVCGICAGVFVKRGAKALAFFFGGIFVLLQVSCVLSHRWARLKSINSILVLHP